LTDWIGKTENSIHQVIRVGTTSLPMMKLSLMLLQEMNPEHF